MRLRFFSMLFLLGKMVSAQWIEDFSDGDFSRQPAWTGDTSDFVVSSAGQLQLQATDAGLSYLFAPVDMPDLNGMEWRFHIVLDFSPSSTNFSRVYLASDQPFGAGNGYFLQFGEALSNDAVELYRQDGASSVSICRATDGAIASAFSIGVKVVRDRDGVWTLFIDPNGGDRYVPEAVGAEGRYAAASWLGIQCNYTVSNSDAFRFDDFYVGPIVEDTVVEAQALPGDVLFSEIYFEPSADSELPEAEFVELFNRSGVNFEIDGWSLSDGSSTAVFPPRSAIHAGTHLIVTAVSDTAAFSTFGPVAGLSGFPALNNDIGDRLMLTDRLGRVIDAIVFSNESYRNPDKSDGGWSIERIDTGFVCPSADNWIASVDPSGGTPGRSNSVAGTTVDSDAPQIDYAWMPDEHHIEVRFTEPVDTSSVAATQAIELISQSGALCHYAANWSEVDLLSLVTEDSCTASNFLLKATSALRDCPGNVADTVSIISTTVATPLKEGALIVNELLSDPFENSSDMVELVNRSDGPIDLYEVFISETDMLSELPLSSPVRISENHRLLYPYQPFAFTRNVDAVLDYYRSSDHKQVLVASNLPDFNVESGGVLLSDRAGKAIDWFPYNESLHHPLLISTDGISLERICFEGESSDPNLWHSAASAAGYATPGKMNSQYITGEGPRTDIEIEPTVFSPDNDGVLDLLSVRYRFSESGRISSLLVFTEQGRFVKALSVGELSGTEGTAYWDGTDETGVLMPRGRYFVFMSSRSKEGREERCGLACGIAY